MGSALALGASWIHLDQPDTSAKRTIALRTIEAQTLHINGFGSDVGAYAASGNTNWASYNWADFDARVQLMRAANRTGGKMSVTLFAPPQWMLNAAPDTWDIFWTPLPPARNNTWASLCAYVAQRYPDVAYFHVWNEMKGYWNDALNRWDYEGYTAMYNAVYSAVKAARPDAKVGGPYVSMRAWSTASGNGNINSNASLDLNGVSSSITGSGYHMDSRELDALNYFRLHNVGVDFVSFDTGLVLDNETYSDPPTLTTADRFAKIPNWIGARFPGKPIWLPEFYYGGGTSNLEAVRSQMHSTGRSITALLWHAVPGEADILFTSAGAQTAIGDAFQAHLQNNRTATTVAPPATVTVGTPVRAWDFQTGNLSQWIEADGAAPTLVTDRPRRSMTYAAKFTAVGGQAATFDAGANPVVDRTEMTDYDLAHSGNIGPGVEQWWAFSVMCPTNLAAPTSWCSITQFHHNGSTGSSPLWFAIQPNTSPPRFQLVMRGGDVNAPTSSTYDLGLAPTDGTWVDFRFFVRWSTGADGQVVVKRNTDADGLGFTVAQYITGPNLYTGLSNYIKQGVYRNTVARTENWYFTGLRRGATEASVTY